MKDNRISKLQAELDSMKANKIDEDRIAKILLMSEIISLELVTANEFSTWAERSKDKMGENREKTVMELLEHCESLLKFAPVVLQNSLQGNGMDSALPDLLNDGHLLMGIAKNGHSKKCDGSEIVKKQQDLKSALIGSKLHMEEQISQIFQNRNSYFKGKKQFSIYQASLIKMFVCIHFSTFGPIQNL